MTAPQSHQATGLAIGALLAAVCLVAVPGTGSPFTAIKQAAGTAGVALLLAWTVATGHERLTLPQTLAAPLAAFVAAMSAAAWTSGSDAFSTWAFLMAGPGLALLTTRLRPRGLEQAASAVVATAVVIALVATAQRAGWDVWTVAGWTPAAPYASDRMRAYATLGNPNFVASVLALSAPWLGACRRLTSPARAGLGCVLFAGRGWDSSPLAPARRCGGGWPGGTARLDDAWRGPQPSS